MGIINRLTPETIHKIAAGEVIERPANAVKEDHHRTGRRRPGPDPGER
jgi:hypothetical protein